MLDAPLDRRSALRAGTALAAGLALGVAGPGRTPAVARAVTGDPQRLTLTVGGTTVVGYRWRAGAGAARPVVVMAQGLGGVQAVALPRLAPQFAAAGYDVVTFDHRTWGESGGRRRNVIDIADELADWRAVVSSVRTLPGVDRTRVVLWGTSLAGGHVLTLGGENLPGVRAVLAQVPHVNGPASTLASDPANVPWLTSKGLADAAAALSGAAPVYVPITGAPGTRALLTQPSSLPGYTEVCGPFLDNRVAARLALQLPFYSPDAGARRSRAATFVAVAADDELCPPEPALELARSMGALAKSYPGAHFDCYPGRSFGAALVADQLAFLRRVVPPA